MNNDDLFDQLDLIDDAHECARTHRTMSAGFDTSGVGFSSDSCALCWAMIGQAVRKIEGDDYEIVTVPRKRTAS